MTDRVTLPLNGKPVDLAQLTTEVGAALLWTDDDEVVVVHPDSGVTVHALRSAVDAHQPAPAVDLAERLAAVEAELRGMKDRAAAVAVTGGAATVRDAITGPADSR